MCFALPEKRIFATLSRVNVIRTCESTTTPARGTRRCAYGIHKRRCVRTYTSSLSMAHCLSHQFAGFMRGLNEVIGFADAINVLIAILIRPFLSQRLIGVFATNYVVRSLTWNTISKYWTCRFTGVVIFANPRSAQLRFRLVAGKLWYLASYRETYRAVYFWHKCLRNISSLFYPW